MFVYVLKKILKGTKTTSFFEYWDDFILFGNGRGLGGGA